MSLNIVSIFFYTQHFNILVKGNPGADVCKYAGRLVIGSVPWIWRLLDEMCWTF